MKALFIGGTGIISAACSERAVARGWELTVLNRGRSTHRQLPQGVRSLVGDASDAASLRAVVGDERFDVVVNFRAFVPEQVRADIDLFAGRVGQYVFISSASAYHKPVERLPITESTALRNPFWQYSRDKIACEELLLDAYRETGFPVTIVRPSHTYDATAVPLPGGWTIVERMRRGAPIVVHGDGTSFWTLTHSRDVAVGLVGLLGEPAAIGEAFHITSHEAVTWRRIAEDLAAAAGVEAEIVTVGSPRVARAIPEWADLILGDLRFSAIFDNSKITAVVPDFGARTTVAQGMREIVAWHDADPKHDADPERRRIDEDLDSRLDALVAAERR